MSEDKLVNQESWKNSGPLNVAEGDPRWRAGYGRGIGGDDMVEPGGSTQRINTTGEQVQNNGNAWVVLGRDRTGSRMSGYGGAGATQASAIDFCVGMGIGSNPGPATAEVVDPNFKSDAARIYISQRTNIDEAFRLTTPESNSDIGISENQSGIGIKADSIRVIGVNGVKLISRPQNKDSRDGTAVYGGIELIACNDQKSLQYMVKGGNLVTALSELEERISAVQEVLFGFLKSQIVFNSSLATHVHVAPQAPGGAIPTLPSVSLVGTGTETIASEIEGVLDTFKEKLNLNINWHQKYLASLGVDDDNNPTYILSRYNKVN